MNRKQAKKLVRRQNLLNLLSIVIILSLTLTLLMLSHLKRLQADNTHITGNSNEVHVNIPNLPIDNQMGKEHISEQINVSAGKVIAVNTSLTTSGDIYLVYPADFTLLNEGINKVREEIGIEQILIQDEYYSKDIFRMVPSGNITLRFHNTQDKQNSFILQIRLD